MKSLNYNKEYLLINKNFLTNYLGLIINFYL